MALVNCYINKNLMLKRKGKERMDHHTFFKKLQHGLLALTRDDFTISTPRDQERGSRAPSPAGVRATEHVISRTADQRENGGQQRSRHRACKVCSIYKGDKRNGFSTTWFRETCSTEKKGLVSLCKTVRSYEEQKDFTWPDMASQVGEWHVCAKEEPRSCVQQWPKPQYCHNAGNQPPPPIQHLTFQTYLNEIVYFAISMS